VEDWGKLLGDSAAVTAMLDRLLHHGHILKCGPRRHLRLETEHNQLMFSQDFPGYWALNVCPIMAVPFLTLFPRSSILPS
jgi:IstB-like ATP binding protein